MKISIATKICLLNVQKAFTIFSSLQTNILDIVNNKNKMQTGDRQKKKLCNYLHNFIFSFVFLVTCLSGKFWIVDNHFQKGYRYHCHWYNLYWSPLIICKLWSQNHKSCIGQLILEQDILWIATPHSLHFPRGRELTRLCSTSHRVNHEILR